MSKHWRTSSYSSGGNCVEVSLPAWRKSTRSDSGNCVEVAFDERPTSLHNPHVLVRDSKDPYGPVLVFTAQEWAAFLAGARDGEFDLERAHG
jgi:hypothetical protein